MSDNQPGSAALANAYATEQRMKRAAAQISMSTDRMIESIKAATGSVEEDNGSRGQVSGAPRMSRKLSAREIRRAQGDFSAGDHAPANYGGLLASEIKWVDGTSTYELIPSIRAPRRVTAGRSR